MKASGRHEEEAGEENPTEGCVISDEAGNRKERDAHTPNAKT
jgi:hypothetical protein